MRRRRALYSSSSDQPWYQNSSDSRRAASSAPTADLVASGSGGTGQRYTTIFLTRTQYTTFIYSNSHSSRSSGQETSSHSSFYSQSRSSITTSPHATSTSSWSSAFTYLPTTFSTTTTARVTTHSTTTVRTIVYVTSTRTVPAVLSSPATTGSSKDTTSAISSPTTTSSVGGGGGHGSLLVSPEGSSKHSAAIAGGMTGSLAGIALIGLLLLFLYRRKRRPPYDEKHELAEPRMSSSSQALPSVVAAAGAPRHSDRSTAPQGSPSGRLPIIDHNLIHMDLNHWDRPFAHEDPHLHDGGSPLRLMNPDPTPTPPIVLTASSSVSHENNPHGFLHRQRSALAAALLSVKRSFSSQDVAPRHASEESHTTYTSAHPSAHPSPLHIQDKGNKLTMPSEVILGGAAGAATCSRPISSQSAMSNNTIIRHHAPDDPFVNSPAAAPYSPLPNCLQPGNNSDGIARRDFLAPPPLRTRMPIQSTPTHTHTARHGAISPLTRSNSECSTRFESLSSPTRSEVSSVSLRSGPFDLASASVVDGDGNGEERVDLQRSQREQTPNWEVHVYPGT